MESKIVNKSELFYETKYDNSNINEYYQYILNGIILFLTKNNVPYSINFGCNNISKDINLDFQYEHTITNNGNGTYSCEVYRFEELIKLESVFEYSKSNINNIKISNHFKKYSDILITCLLDYGEPAVGQTAFDNATDLNGNFVFDELGLKSYIGAGTQGTGKLLTHVIFHPVQKSLNRLIQIEYTVRVQTLTNLT